MNEGKMSPQVEAALQRLAGLLRSRGQLLACAESCTGGLIAAACTSLAGSSDWFDRGFVSYSNLAKCEMLGVDPSVLGQHGAVSEAIALAMAEGAIARSSADWSVAVTGIAGPGGAVPGKPVGTVWLAIGSRLRPARASLLQLDGGRAAIRSRTVESALQALCVAIESAAFSGPAALRPG